MNTVVVATSTRIVLAGKGLKSFQCLHLTWLLLKETECLKIHSQDLRLLQEKHLCHEDESCWYFSPCWNPLYPVFLDHWSTGDQPPVHPRHADLLQRKVVSVQTRGFCRAEIKLQFGSAVARQENNPNSDVMPESNQIQDLLMPRNNSIPPK